MPGNVVTGMDWTDIYTRIEADRNDQFAWQALQERVRAWACAHLRGETWHTIEDVIADTCSSVAVCFSRARGDETFAGFVYGCYLNERRRTLAYVLRTRPSRVSLSEADLPVHFDDPQVQVEERSVVWQVLACLPPRERTAVALRHLEGLSAEDIAALLGVSEGNARHIIYKGLRRLRQRIGSDAGADLRTSPVTL
jgi:RNA polymerase sigma-70 factor, ECF subfamily